MKWLLPTGLSCVVALLAPAARGGDAPPHSTDTVILQNCATEYKVSTVVSALEDGILQECLVRPGEAVKAGQILARIRDEDLRNMLEIKSTQLQSDVELQVAEAQYKQAATKLRTSEKLARERYLSADDFELVKLDVALKGVAVEEAKKNRRVAELLMKQALASLENRTLRSPHDGVVAASSKRVGELIQRTDPAVFRVDNQDALRVTGHVDVVDLWRVKVGLPVRVTVEIGGADLPIETEGFVGKVVSVGTAITPETQTCPVVAEIENRGHLLRAGLIARMEIQMGEDAKAAKPVAAAPPQPPRADPPRTAASPGR